MRSLYIAPTLSSGCAVASHAVAGGALVAAGVVVAVNGSVVADPAVTGALVPFGGRDGGRRTVSVVLGAATLGSRTGLRAG